MSGGTYPLPYAFAYFFFVGHLARQAFISLRLPGPVAILITGFSWSYFVEDEMLAARTELQLLAFFIVLLRAGLELELQYAFKARVVMLVLVPAILELGTITLYAVYKLHWSPIQGLVLGCTLFPLGEGLVLPKMADFQGKFPGHPLVKLMIAWAPLEATFALTAFGVLTGLSEPARAATVTHDPGLLIGGAILQIVLTIIAGSLLGFVTGVLTRHRRVVYVPNPEDVAAYAAATKTKMKGKAIRVDLKTRAASMSSGSSGSSERAADPPRARATPRTQDVDETPACEMNGSLSRDPSDDNEDLVESVEMRRASRDRGESYDTFDLPPTASEKVLRLAHKPVFSGSQTESLLLLLSAALAALGLGEEGGFPAQVVPGMKLFQPELNVIVTGCSFAIGAGHQLLEEVRVALDGVWVFGGIVLFGMIGSKTTLSVFAYFGDVIPIMVLSVAARGFGIYCCVLSQRLFRSKCRCRSCTVNTVGAGFIDATFYFVCVCTRASIQGALGSIPVQQSFFSSDKNNLALQSFISSASKLYIIVFALGGSIVMELFGPWLLRKSLEWHDFIESANCPVQKARANIAKSAKLEERYDVVETADCSVRDEILEVDAQAAQPVHALVCMAVVRKAAPSDLSNTIVSL